MAVMLLRRLRMVRRIRRQGRQFHGRCQRDGLRWGAVMGLRLGTSEAMPGRAIWEMRQAEVWGSLGCRDMG